MPFLLSLEARPHDSLRLAQHLNSCLGYSHALVEATVVMTVTEIEHRKETVASAGSGTRVRQQDMECGSSASS